MAPTNERLWTLLTRIEARLRQIERRPSLDPLGGAAIGRLRAEREAVKLVLVNRRVEASRRVVSLSRWRSANGAMLLLDARRTQPDPAAGWRAGPSI